MPAKGPKSDQILQHNGFNKILTSIKEQKKYTRDKTPTEKHKMTTKRQKITTERHKMTKACKWAAWGPQNGCKQI